MSGCMNEAGRKWVNKWMDGAEGIIWHGRGQGGLGMTKRFLEVELHKDHPKGTMAQPTPRGWGFQGRAWLNHPQLPCSWGCCGLVFSVLPASQGNRRRPRGKGERTFPKHGLGWSWGTHSCAWPGVGSSNQLFAWPWLAQLGLAGVAVHEPGGQRGGMAPSLGLQH